jgi:hypothetical protein
MRTGHQGSCPRRAQSLPPDRPPARPRAAPQARVISEPRPPFRVVAVSREFERLSGWRAAEVRGLALAELLQGGAAAPETLRGIRSAAATYERVTLACVHARWVARKRVRRVCCCPMHGGLLDAANAFGGMGRAPAGIHSALTPECGPTAAEPARAPLMHPHPLDLRVPHGNHPLTQEGRVRGPRPPGRVPPV